MLPLLSGLEERHGRGGHVEQAGGSGRAGVCAHRLDDLDQAAVGADDEAEDADDHEDDVLEDEEAGEAAGGVRHAQLDDGGEGDAEGGQAQGAEQRDEQIEQRDGHGQADCNNHVIIHSFFSFLSLGM